MKRNFTQQPAMDFGLPISATSDDDGTLYDEGCLAGQEDMPTAEIAEGGNLVRLRAGTHVSIPLGGGKRGRIVEYSRSARKRLLNLLNTINRTAVRVMPLFITLTYPAVWVNNANAWKRHLDTFGKAVRKKYPTAAFIWKLEYQKRGAPHFHLILFGVPFIPWQWVAQQWWVAVGSGDITHLVAGTEVRRIKSWRGVMSYAAKYMTKAGLPASVPYSGRFWGVIGRSLLPILVHLVLLTWQEYYRMRRALWRYMDSKGCGPRCRGSFQGCTVYINDIAAWRLANHIVL